MHLKVRSSEPEGFDIFGARRSASIAGLRAHCSLAQLQTAAIDASASAALITAHQQHCMQHRLQHLTQSTWRCVLSCVSMQALKPLLAVTLALHMRLVLGLGCLSQFQVLAGRLRAVPTPVAPSRPSVQNPHVLQGTSCRTSSWQPPATKAAAYHPPRGRADLHLCTVRGLELIKSTGLLHTDTYIIGDSAYTYGLAAGSLQGLEYLKA
jgi:hypothetical protein